MFRKLISNLPFNPSLVSQVSFYAKRINEEATIRRAGFVLIALAMFIQMFAVIAPPEKSLAASDNHIINGINTRDDMLGAWDAPNSDIPAIYGQFGVTREDIQKLPQTPNAVLNSGDGTDWWSIGRNPLSNYANVQDLYKQSEVALNTGPTTVYMRKLTAWDTHGSSTYQAFTGVKADGTRFWILKDCGNYTQVGKFAPNAPSLEMRKTIAGPTTTFKPGDTFTFRFEYRNNVQNSLAENVILHDDLDLASFDVISPTDLNLSGNSLNRPLGSLSYTANYNVLDITVRLKSPFPTGFNGRTCNAAKLTSANATEAWGGPACVDIFTPCEYDASKPKDANCVPPDVCPNVPGVQLTLPSNRIINENGNCVAPPSTYDDCPNIPGLQPFPPAGQIKDASGNCVPPPPVDVCPNIPGAQGTVPTGQIKDADGNCIAPPVDVCPNINGNQPTVPTGQIKDASGNCVDVCKYDSSKPTGDSCKAPDVYCALVDTYLNKVTREATFITSVTSTNDKIVKVSRYSYEFGDKKTEVVNTNAFNNTVKHTYAAGTYNAKVKVDYTINNDPGTAKSVTCAAPIEFENDKPFGEMKKVKNITQNLEGDKVLSKKLVAGDVLEYSLITSNTQNYARTNHTVVDYVGDVLDYADIDLTHLATQGGTFDAKTKKVSFVLASIDAKSEVSKSFKITLKSPLPSTNTPSNVSGSFDCEISNKYGNELNMLVACPAVKKLETIPNTGAGTSAMLGFAIVTIVGYFFARSRLMAKELAILKTEYAPSGGF